MKYLSLLFLVPTLTYGSYSKPQLVARMMYTDAWNVPDSTWCFSGEPAMQKGEVYLNCFDEQGTLMAKWGAKGFEVVARAQGEQMFSKAVNSFDKISFYEFSEYSIERSYVVSDRVEKIELRNLGTMNEATDSFLPYTHDAFFFKTKGNSPQLWIWKNDEIKSFFNPKAAFIFAPTVGPQGEIVVKTRDNHLGENAPDKLWLYFNNEWKVILEDKDTDPEVAWKSLRHQYAVDGDKVLLVANDGKNDSLITVSSNGIVEVIATAGKELKSFDYFSPKMRAGSIIVRGEDFEGNKVTYVKDQRPFRRLLSQGDVVMTDRGAGRVFYQSKDAIFYGAGGIDERGNIVLQATLTDADYPKTLLGVGLIKFNRE
jgi:hypothetical protein